MHKFLSLNPLLFAKTEIRGNSSARDGHDMDIAGFCHMIFVENLEKGILPLTITDFIFQQLRISCQAFVLPSNPSEAYTRGITMVNNKRNLDLLSDFLESSDHVVTPSSGRYILYFLSAILNYLQLVSVDKVSIISVISFLTN